MNDRYHIGGEHYSAVALAIIYFFLGLLFTNIIVSLTITALFITAIWIDRRGHEAPLAILVRTSPIVFSLLILLLALKTF